MQVQRRTADELVADLTKQAHREGWNLKKFSAVFDLGHAMRTVTITMDRSEIDQLDMFSDTSDE